jgi:hypothetical protein
MAQLISNRVRQCSVIPSGHKRRCMVLGSMASSLQLRCCLLSLIVIQVCAQDEGKLALPEKEQCKKSK